VLVKPSLLIRVLDPVGVVYTVVKAASATWTSAKFFAVVAIIDPYNINFLPPLMVSSSPEATAVIFIRPDKSSLISMYI